MPKTETTDIATERPLFDPTIRLDFLLAFALVIGSMLALGAKVDARVDGLERNQRTTTEILEDLKRQVKDNKARIDYRDGFEEGRRYERGTEDG